MIYLVSKNHIQAPLAGIWTKGNVVFYNEREWRYIPVEHKLLLMEEDFLNEPERKKYNEDV